MAAEAPVATRGELLAGAAARLAAAGCDTPRLDAELLLAGAAALDRAALVAGALEPVGADAASRLESLLARREAREPVAYILGRRGFRHLDLAVDERVLIPRPETELLVEAAVELPAGARVADVGTGSGAVALALAQERPDLAVTGLDASGGALAVARANALRLGLRAEFVMADLLAGAPGPWDAVVANLPYVDAADWDGLAPEITRWEPREALVAGAAGLALIRRLIAQLGETPFTALEVGAQQAPAVAATLAATGRRVQTLQDLAGIERVVVGRR